MRQLRRLRRSRRRALLAIALLGVAYALVMQTLGWAQTSHFAQVKALAAGSAQIDRDQWETGDKAWHDGHFHSVKAPGLALLTLPAYLALDAAGAPGLSARAAAVAAGDGESRWHDRHVSIANYGWSIDRRDAVQRRIERQSALVWALGLLGTVAPALVLLALVRWAGERLVPGGGLPAAVTLGAGTLVLPFATQFFSHLLSTTLAFAAFALLLAERTRGPWTRLTRVALAGLLAGLAVTTEYPLALAAALIGGYALAGAWREPSAALRRGAAYAAGALAGVAPLAVYNAWAFGSLAHSSYAAMVREGGLNGRAVLGLHDGGLFGIGVPEPWTALELLLSARGLLTIAPVTAAGACGLVLLHRRGWRAEALLAAAIGAGSLTWAAGFWGAFGGATPGPRFLIPALPFLALGLAAAWRVRPLPTAALAGPSVVLLLAATVTRPLIGDHESAGVWAGDVGAGLFTNTVGSALGLGNGWLATAPVLACVALALALGLPRAAVASRRELKLAATALASWLGLACAAPAVWGAPAVVTGDLGAGALFAAGALGGALLVAATYSAQTPVDARGRAEHARLRPQRVQHAT